MQTSKADPVTGIRVLTDDEILEKWLWTKSGSLAAEFPWVPEEWIRRMLTACQQSGMDSDLAIARYLQGDKSVAVTSEFREVFREMTDRAQRPWLTRPNY